MSEVQSPPWLEGRGPTPVGDQLMGAPRGPGNPSWKPGCVSPNPTGRPKGIPDKRLLATQQMLDEMRNITAVLVAKALEGDTGAASIVMSKVLPSIKAQAEKVRFDFDASATVSQQVAQVLEAVAAGAVAPDVGRLIIESIKALADVRATEELEGRITALEEARVA